MIYLALPVMNEAENLPSLVACLEKQTFKNFSLTVCVNQYDQWHRDPDKKHICADNLESLHFFNNLKSFPVKIIDKSSQGKGWLPKKGGVGHARKTIMDEIAATAGDNDIIVSIDADTFYPENYLKTVNDTFQQYNKVVGLSLPYYHPLPSDSSRARLILRYEMYMRYYALNMIRIRNPYRFTALGSAMAFPVRAYKKAGGLTPVPSGEDFYFLQKLVKTGTLLCYADTVAYPAARFSDRVGFGTGPALIKGSTGNWDSYPFYPHRFFDEIKETYTLFETLFEKDVSFPMRQFLSVQFNNEQWWRPLRRNFKTKKQFASACRRKTDGLRILQYLRFRYREEPQTAEEVLRLFIQTFFNEDLTTGYKDLLEELDFENQPVEHLNGLRDMMFEKEKSERLKNNDHTFGCFI